MKLFSLSLVVSVLAGPVLANTWETSIQRGFETYVAEAENGSVTLVCDPDRVYNPDVSYANFVVSLPADPRAESIVFLAQTGQQAMFVVRDGVATQKDANPEAWSKLVNMVSTGGQFAVVSPRASMILTMDPVSNFECL